MKILQNIKSRLKNNDLLMRVYNATYYGFRALLYDISPVVLAKYHYKTKYGKWPNIDNPEKYDEKLLWLMLYWRHPLKILCTDKYAVRTYVKEQGLEHTLPKLLGVYEESRDIDYEVLPVSFVLKCTHGCGFNVICKDKSKLNIEDTKRKLDAWMKIDISKVCGEIHYSDIKPRIICEEYLDDSSGKQPVDYKVHCISGNAHCTLICTDRDNGAMKYDFYDREWNKIPYSKSSMLANRINAKPTAYDEIIYAAEKLAKPFPFVRVDFYSIKGRAVFGEMTFTPNGCVDSGLTEIAQKEMGKRITLSDQS